MIHYTHDILHHIPWRDVKKSQLTELYISMMIRTLGLSLVGIFVPVYLFQLGYSIPSIALFFVAMYGFRIPLDLVSARLVGYFGPKHIMMLSQIFLIISFAQYFTLETYSWPLALIAVTNGVANGLFFMAYHIEFSKIQSTRDSGKQIGTMYQIAKLASAVGPLVGGILAQSFGFSVVIGVAIFLVLLSSVPLALSPEPVRKYQHITFKGFPWKKVKWDIISNTGLGFDQMAAMLVWPLFVSIYILSDNVYAGVGIVTSVGFLSSVFFARVSGRIIDRDGGAKLLKAGVVGESIVNIARFFVNSIGLTYVFNAVAEPVQNAVRMPYTKGLYAAASSYEGYRDVYIATIMTSANIVRATTWLVVFFCAHAFGDKIALQSVFILAGVSIWFVLLQRFKALR